MEQSTARKESENSNPSLLSKLGDIMLLSLCFVLGCLPVITIGASATALYYAINKRYTDHSVTPASDFFKSYKKNLRQGIILTIFLLGYLGGSWFFVYYSLFGWDHKNPPGWCLPVAVALAIPTLFVAMFLFPYLARFKNTVLGTIFHSFTFSMMYLGHTVTMWLIVLASIALMVVFPPFALFVPFICCFLCRRLCEPDFNYAILLRDKREHPEKYPSETPEEEDDEDEEYEDEGEDEDSDEEDDEYEDEDDESDEEDDEYDEEEEDDEDDDDSDEE